MMSYGLTRREAIKTTGIIAGSAVLASSSAAETAEANIVLDGKTGGWVGRKPDSIAGVTNPTLEFTRGQEYTIAWENIDGAQHNIAILDSEREELESTEIISGEGATQILEFEATSEMADYYCVVHPGSMEGPVEITSEEDVNTETFTVETSTSSSTSTENATSTSQDDTAGNESTEDSSETQPSGGGSGSDEIVPGFGVGAALAGIGGTAAYLLRNQDEP